MGLATFDRHALVATSSVILAVLLGACATSSNVGMPSLNDSKLRFGQTSKQTFKFTGAEQQFTVPSGITKITIIANGARGSEGVGDGASGGKYDPPGGLGGRVIATISVRPGEDLAVFVGGKGTRRGFNGGGTGRGRFGHGGGASDVRQGGDSLDDRVVVAGGGGGGGAVGFCESTSCGYGAGGHGGIGGRDGGSGGNGKGYLHGAGGGGGTQRGGGKGGAGSGSGCDGADGTLGGGGAGKRTCGGFGGGGGGGYFGGGGGGGGGREGSTSGSGFFGPGGGGGGGSSFAEKSATNVQMLPGVRAGDGLITISW